MRVGGSHVSIFVLTPFVDAQIMFCLLETMMSKSLTYGLKKKY